MGKRLVLRTAVAGITATGCLAFVPPAFAQAPGRVATAAATAQPFDFNGDGKRDTALGSPYGKVGSQASSGFVTVVYGTNPLSKQVISQATEGVPGAAEAGDHFGYAVGSADLDQDGFADLVVGGPDEDVGDEADDGTVWVIWGSATGLKESVLATNPDQGPDFADRFGTSLTAGMYNGAGKAPMALVGSHATGGVWGLRFGPQKRTAPRLENHRPARSGEAKASAPNSGDNTTYLSTGDVNNDGYQDYAQIWRDQDVGDDTYAVLVLLGAATDEFAEHHGRFGVAGEHGMASDIAVGDFNGDKFADVAVGSASDKSAKGGKITVYRGGADPISEANSYTIDQDTGKVPGAAETGDQFGYSVSAGDINSDGKDDLAIGAPREDLSGKTDAGTAVVLLGGDKGLRTDASATSVTQDTPGVSGVAESNDLFGYQVTLLASSTGAHLLAGAPQENGQDGAYWDFPGTKDGVDYPSDVNLGAPALGVPGVKAQIGIRLGRA